MPLCFDEAADKVLETGASTCILLPEGHATSGTLILGLSTDVLLPTVNSLFIAREAKSLQHSCNILVSCVAIYGEQVIDLVLASQLKACDALMSLSGAANLATFALATWKSGAARQCVKDAPETLNTIIACQAILSGVPVIHWDAMNVLLQFTTDSTSPAQTVVSSPTCSSSCIQIISLPHVHDTDLVKALSHAPATKATLGEDVPQVGAPPTGMSPQVWSMVCGLVDNCSTVLIMEEPAHGETTSRAQRVHGAKETDKIRPECVKPRTPTIGALEAEVQHLRSLLTMHGISTTSTPPASTPTYSPTGTQTSAAAAGTTAAATALRQTLSTGSSFLSVGSEGWAPGTPTTLPQRCQAGGDSSGDVSEGSSGTSTLLPAPASGEVTCDIHNGGDAGVVATMSGDGSPGQVTAHLQAACDVLQARLSLGKLPGPGNGGEGCGDVDVSGRCIAHHITLTRTTTSPLTRSCMSSMNGSFVDATSSLGPSHHTSSCPSRETPRSRVSPKPIITHFMIEAALAACASTATSPSGSNNPAMATAAALECDASHPSEYVMVHGDVGSRSARAFRTQPTFCVLNRTASAPSSGSSAASHAARPPRCPPSSMTPVHHTPGALDVSEQLRLARAELAATKAQLAALTARLTQNDNEGEQQLMIDELQEEVDMLRSECAASAQHLSAAQTECASLHMQLKRQAWIMRQMQDRLNTLESSLKKASSQPASPRCKTPITQSNTATPTNLPSHIPRSPSNAIPHLLSLAAPSPVAPPPTASQLPTTLSSQPNSPCMSSMGNTCFSRLPTNPSQPLPGARTPTTRPVLSTATTPTHQEPPLKTKLSNGSNTSQPDATTSSLPRYMQPTGLSTPRGATLPQTTTTTHHKPAPAPKPSAAFAPPTFPSPTGLCRQTSLGPRIPACTPHKPTTASTGVVAVVSAAQKAMFSGTQSLSVGSGMAKLSAFPAPGPTRPAAPPPPITQYVPSSSSTPMMPMMKQIPKVVISGGMVRLVPYPLDHEDTIMTQPPLPPAMGNMGSNKQPHTNMSARSRVQVSGPPTSLPGRPALASVADVEGGDGSGLEGSDEEIDWDVELSMPPSLGASGLNHQHVLRACRG